MLGGTETSILNDVENSKKVLDKFNNITPEDVANYLVANFDELRKNPLIDLFIEKEVWKIRLKKV
ncbi:hypothetical protein KCTC52924_00544 [Arenibacter antarcticus]|uniref:Uncharacterized protein n=1 Tax=Arenibacter antarcticus TaxID=2040469 RepID=A0ABW5VFK4_9FLAO|nr:hypothetical protein [Arenibacter sp. H213]MCM4169508.1 hypothetical protein [Arenibacter sp. H213]